MEVGWRWEGEEQGVGPVKEGNAVFRASPRLPYFVYHSGTCEG
jgi:hypothetical protein